MTNKTMLVFSRNKEYDQFVGDVPTFDDFIQALTKDDPEMGWKVLEALADKLIGQKDGRGYKIYERSWTSKNRRQLEARGKVLVGESGDSE